MGWFQTYWPLVYFILGLVITWGVWVTRKAFERDGCIKELRSMLKQFIELHQKHSDLQEKSLSDRIDKLERKK